MVRDLSLNFSDPILGIDLATTTGWALIEGGYHVAGEKKFSSNNDSRLRGLRSWITDIVSKTRPKLIAIERPFINARSSTVTLLHMHGVVLERLSDCKAPIMMIGNTEAKMKICGRGDVTSKEKKQGAMVKALKQKGFDVKGTDAADALAVALVARINLFQRIK